jgi:tetratricopeptide (TPR) repeat protein/predicted Ser/Thr protein kinase
MESKTAGGSRGAGAPGSVRPGLGPTEPGLQGGAHGLTDGASDEANHRTGEHESPLGRGDMVDRYVILSSLGQGGMGVVFAAYDPELDRKVALKLLLPAAAAQSGTRSESRTRLLREAQALAQLSHPAVVAVHDVGTVGDQVWLAMEFVDGVTLTSWCERPRTWREVLELFRRAGEGLAAAHAAGLVHRDFKPDNVMVGADGRVRVMDFGLARADGPSRPPPRSELRVSRSALRAEVTVAGSVMGTPAYMAPEQWLGGATDARTDQFAFCVALWEALYGERPFAGDTHAALAHRVTTGRHRDPPARSKVPTWLRKVVERGLLPVPARRWPSMATLLAALVGGAGRRQRRLAIVGVAGLVAVFATAEAGRRWNHAEAVAACEARGESIAEVWNKGTREGMRAALVATEVSYAESTHEHLAPRLDEFTAGWSAARTQACLHSEVEDTWDGELATRADECLLEARWALEELVAALLTADASVVTRAVAAAAGLPPVAPCLDPGWLARRPRPPQDERARGEAAALVRALEQARTLLALGDYAEGVVRARQLSARADALGWTPLTARVRITAGELAERAGERREAEKLLEDGLFLANEAGEDVMVVQAAALLTYTVGDRLARPEDGLRWGRLGQSLLPRLGPAAKVVEADLYDHLGNVEQLRGNYDAAEGWYTKGLASATALHGPDHPDVAVVLNNLAAVHYVRGDYGAANSLYERAMAIFEAILGPDHPNMAAFANNLGSVQFARGEYDEAERLFSRALAIRERSLGPDHTDVAMPLGNLAGVHLVRGDPEKARRLLERALAIYEREFGPDHIEVAATLDTLGQAYVTVGDLAAARRTHARALAIREATLGPDHVEVADSLYALADVQRAQGDPVAAESLYRRALAIVEKTLGEQHMKAAVIRRGLAEALIVLGRPAEAASELAPAMTAKANDPPLRLAAARFTLAQALWADGTPTRAVELAREAAAAYRAASPPEPKLLAEVEAWLAGHRAP